MTTQAAATEEAEPKKEDIEQLKRWLEHFANVFRSASQRKERCEDLMRRQGAKKWDAAKTAKMVRKLMTANKEIEDATNALDQVTHRLSQNGIEVDIISRSGTKAA